MNPLEDVKKLILAEIEKVKKGKFEEWLLPAILADFEKTEQVSYHLCWSHNHGHLDHETQHTLSSNNP